MLQSIKSPYFIKFIFSFINEKRKLNLIKYNNCFKNLIGINIINYRFFSGKYIIYEKTGFGKEYNAYDDSLLFEGEYLNGERNGKGKEFSYDGILLFEGEYLNGQRNGKGKEYYRNGNLKFEGEYLNGKRLNGIEYNNEGGLDYIREYKD